MRADLGEYQNSVLWQSWEISACPCHEGTEAEGPGICQCLLLAVPSSAQNGCLSIISDDLGREGETGWISDNISSRKCGNVDPKWGGSG